MVDVKIVKDDKELTTPHYAHEGDAGIDLRSSVNYVLKPGETKPISTGIRMAIPKGYVGLVWDKSGYAAKQSIHTMAGVIDSGYRGEIKIVMKNLGDEDFDIKKDMKIAQILIQPIVRANLIEQDSLEDTTRGEGGFGSTGRT
ncbi:MAG: dUTP diphosphatase [Nanoarchaeota archaeon]